MRRLASLAAIASIAALTVAACKPTASTPLSGSTAPPSAAAAAATTQLASLTVATSKSMAGYSRDRFPHWRRVDAHCDTRDAVLKRDGTDVKVNAADCKITAGTWHSLYDDKTVKDAGQLDIDHMVPLANAWRSGADTWTDDQRSDFANDMTRPQLLAVSLTTNRAKGDQDPSTWKPPNAAFWCEYAERWVAVKAFWKLTITDREKSALQEMLGSCKVQNNGK